MAVVRHKKKKEPRSYQKRSYRGLARAEGLQAFSVTVRETDLHILASIPMEEEAQRLVLQARSQLESYIADHGAFLSSLTPLPPDPTAPPLARKMLAAAHSAGVGPMAAIAGAIAEYVGTGLLVAGADEVIVENGGDVFLHRRRDCLVTIFAGQSPWSTTRALRLRQDQRPCGVCTSSGSVGHSLSLGQADSATVIAESTALADAAATALGNQIQTQDDLNAALEAAHTIPGVRGALLIHNDRLGAWGDVQIEPII
jgi:ApbE superfamily uncharacterized protein (UPF0280 family)